MTQLNIDYNTKFKQILEEAYVNPNEEIKRPPVAIYKGYTDGPYSEPIPLCTYGNFSFIQAPPKSRKTFLVSLLSSVYLAGNNNFGGDIQANSADKCLIHYDTEQGTYHAQKVFNRITRMANNKGKYLSYALRKYTAQERLQFIDWHLYNTDKLGFVVIDGIADLVEDVNDIVAASNLVQHLMKWTEELGIHIVTVIHSNFGSNKPTGHLGSFLEKKCETQIAMEYDEETNLSIVKCMRSRGVSFDDFSFEIVKGLPYVTRELPSEVDGESFF